MSKILLRESAAFVSMQYTCTYRCVHSHLLWCNPQPSGAYLDCVWNVMPHAQKPGFVFRRNGRVHLNRRGGGGMSFSRLLAGELCTLACRAFTALVSLCSAVKWRLLVTHSILLFPLHFSSRASPRAITIQLYYTNASRDHSNFVFWLKYSKKNFYVAGKLSFKKT
jgi:hypothetical protein